MQVISYLLAKLKWNLIADKLTIELKNKSRVIAPIRAAVFHFSTKFI